MNRDGLSWVVAPQGDHEPLNCQFLSCGHRVCACRAYAFTSCNTRPHLFAHRFGKPRYEGRKIVLCTRQYAFGRSITLETLESMTLCFGHSSYTARVSTNVLQ